MVRCCKIWMAQSRQKSQPISSYWMASSDKGAKLLRNSAKVGALQFGETVSSPLFDWCHTFCNIWRPTLQFEGLPSLWVMSHLTNTFYLFLWRSRTHLIWNLPSRLWHLPKELIEGSVQFKDLIRCFHIYKVQLLAFSIWGHKPMPRSYMSCSILSNIPAYSVPCGEVMLPQLTSVISSPLRTYNSTWRCSVQRRLMRVMWHS